MKPYEKIMRNDKNSQFAQADVQTIADFDLQRFGFPRGDGTKLRVTRYEAKDYE